MFLDIEEKGEETILTNIDELGRVVGEDTIQINKKREPENSREKQLINFYYNSLVLSANKSYLGKPGNFIELGSPFCLRINKEVAKKIIEGESSEIEKSINDLKIYFNNGEKYVKNNGENRKLNKFKSYCLNSFIALLSQNQEEIEKAKKSIYLFLKDAEIDQSQLFHPLFQVPFLTAVKN